MKKLLIFLVVALHAACGSGQTSPGELNTLTFDLGQGSGTSLRVMAGATTYVYVKVLGASGRSVTFQSANLPDFASFSVDGVLTLSPSKTTVGEYGFTINALVGDENISTDAQIIVERPNTPPTLVMAQVSDPRGFPQLSPHILQWDCLQDPYLEAIANDPEQDPIGLEITATSVEQSPAETLTYRAPVRTPANPRTQNVEFLRKGGFAVKLTGLAPGIPYVFSVRAVDALGAASGWWTFAAIRCLPFGINLEGNDWQSSVNSIIRLSSAQSRTVPLLLEGTSSEPIVLTAEGLPSFATLSGTALTFNTPVVDRHTSTEFTVVATSGGLTSRNKLRLYIDP